MRKRSQPVVDGIGERIRRRREAAGMSQAELAEAMGGNASRVEVNHYECDRRQPSAAKLVDLARALQCSVDWLLGLSTKP